MEESTDSQLMLKAAESSTCKKKLGSVNIRRVASRAHCERNLSKTRGYRKCGEEGDVHVGSLRRLRE